MKKRILLLVVVALCAQLSFVASASAQDPSEKESHPGGWKKWIELLPGGEQTKFKAVRALAMEDTAVRAADEKRKQAEKDFHDLLRATMLKIDPSVQGILDKMPEPKKKHHRW